MSKPKPTYLDQARALPGWSERLPALAAKVGMTPADVETVLGMLEAGALRVVSSLDTSPGVWTTRTYTKEDGSPQEKHRWRDGDTPVEMGEIAVDLARHAPTWMAFQDRWDAVAARVAVILKEDTAARRRALDAARKRAARAAGKVRDKRPRRGPPSLSARIESTGKSLATRRLTLAKLQALVAEDQSRRLQLANDIMRCSEGISRAEQTLRTYQRRKEAGEE